MEALSFSLAVLTLLAVPGPTNTLLAASGAALGWRRSLPLLLAEISGYILSISLLMAVLGPIIAAQPVLCAGLKLAAGGWIAWCGWRMWRQSAQTLAVLAVPVGFRQVFLTTLTNPKAVIFALAVFPPIPLAQQGPTLALFSLITIVVGASWIMLGALLARAVAPRRVQAMAALALGLFAVTLGAQAATSLVATPTISDMPR
ncbi:putative lysine exporter protein [Magnetospirillum gryphiswaldense MSR-1 v2]|uniref:Lysine exporter protein n=1 Tax=Magnetospirillum gryphiswaldense (strain DSM 6361 / JCM 21280 / NBRC 15271 / MSR-1) TaxID=431944 RepID=V6EW59_MAGGM|nr:LysE family transporter [Magnetospirillum gryphiswaldense]CDK97520.1 putative lysine exporter protein [Magnetospirillum gryphiswaldense MSR-1 v2]